VSLSLPPTTPHTSLMPHASSFYFMSIPGKVVEKPVRP
jgi:hypothetical protein